jgi:hypothetical protein
MDALAEKHPYLAKNLTLTLSLQPFTSITELYWLILDCTVMGSNQPMTWLTGGLLVLWIQ